MDNLTHSLVGALIGQAGLKKKTGLAMPALIIGANLPDVDVACFAWLSGTQHLGFRRGITHGPIAWVLLPLVLASLLYGYDRWQARRGKRPDSRLPVSFGWLYALAFIACLTHPALDWLNVYGIRLLSPFSERWFYGDTLFIIDVWLWLGLGFATWLSLRRERQGGEWRRPARIGLAVALAYIGLNVAITWIDEATSGVSAPIAIANPPVLVFWQRGTIIGEPNDWSVRGENGRMHPVTEARCSWPDVEALRQGNPDLDAFLIWSRAPFAERAPDGSVLIRDARFAGRGTGSFTVALPNVPCKG